MGSSNEKLRVRAVCNPVAPDRVPGGIERRKQRWWGSRGRSGVASSAPIPADSIPAAGVILRRGGVTRPWAGTRFRVMACCVRQSNRSHRSVRRMCARRGAGAFGDCGARELGRDLGRRAPPDYAALLDRQLKGDTESGCPGEYFKAWPAKTGGDSTPRARRREDVGCECATSVFRPPPPPKPRNYAIACYDIIRYRPRPAPTWRATMVRR